MVIRYVSGNYLLLKQFSLVVLYSNGKHSQTGSFVSVLPSHGVPPNAGCSPSARPQETPSDTDTADEGMLADRTIHTVCGQ